jgi:8-oxo-dGTP diphosphatase
MARTPVQAAGGIVLRQAKPPLIAVVRLRKRNEWVLPKGKLDDGETHREAAEREVNEETGHEVTVHEFLGTLVYETGGRSKIVHYWRMQADGEQVYELMTDIREVDWLPLEVALTRLSRASERAFLEHVGPVAVASTLADQAKRKAKAAAAVKPAPATRAAPATKAAPKPAAATKAAPTPNAAPARKRRTPPAVPVQPPPEAEAATQPAVDLQFAPHIEPPPAPPEMPASVASEPIERTPMTAEPQLPVEAQEPVTVEPLADQPELILSADTVEPTPAPEQADRPAALDKAGVPATEATEGRRKSLGERLRNWLASVA